MPAPLLRHLHLAHRWLGIAACLLLFGWFGSGLVMLYVPFPQLGADARLAQLPPLAVEALRIDPARAASLCPGELRGLRLASLGARPVWHLQTSRGPCSIWADSGLPVGPVSPEAARETARRFLGRATMGAVEAIERDQWTVYASYRAHRPLYRVAAGDAAGSEVYVSSRSGEVLVHTTRRERGWNRVGAVLHWLYFTPLHEGRAALARQLLLALSFTALLAAASGLVQGLVRLRWRLKRRYPGGRVTPYRGAKRVHHLLGLAVGGFALSWLVSGWLSQHPLGLLDLNAPPPGSSEGLAGGPFRLDSGLPLLQRQLARLPALRELEAYRFGGRTYFELRAPGARLQVDEEARIAPPFTPQALAAALQAVLRAPVAEAGLIHQADLYYYGHRQAPLLPVARIRFADAEDSTWYLDPASGRVLQRIDQAGRRHRWLFNALHRFDFPPLAGHSGLREALLTLLCLLGATFAASACAIGWRRLVRKRTG